MVFRLKKKIAQLRLKEVKVPKVAVSQEINNQRLKYKEFMVELANLKAQRNVSFVYKGLSYVTSQNVSLLRSNLPRHSEVLAKSTNRNRKNNFAEKMERLDEKLRESLAEDKETLKHSRTFSKENRSRSGRKIDLYPPPRLES